MADNTPPSAASRPYLKGHAVPHRVFFTAKPLDCRPIGGSSSFLGSKIAKMVSLVFYSNTRNPAVTIWDKNRALNLFSWFFVLLVLPVRGRAQIGEPIISAVAVDVVDLIVGPRPSLDKPRKTVGVDLFAEQTDGDVTTRAAFADNLRPTESGLTTFDPNKNAGFWVVRDVLSNFFSGHAHNIQGQGYARKGLCQC